MTLYILFVSFMNGIYFRIRYLQAIAYSMKRCIGPLFVERPDLCIAGLICVQRTHFFWYRPGPTLRGTCPGPLFMEQARAFSVWYGSRPILFNRPTITLSGTDQCSLFTLCVTSPA